LDPAAIRSDRGGSSLGGGLLRLLCPHGSVRTRIRAFLPGVGEVESGAVPRVRGRRLSVDRQVRVCRA
jgi:hypothetical protein